MCGNTEGFALPKKLPDRIFPSPRPPEPGLIESSTLLQEVFVMSKPPLLSIKLLLLGRIPEQESMGIHGDPWESDGDDKIAMEEATMENVWAGAHRILSPTPSKSRIQAQIPFLNPCPAPATSHGQGKEMGMGEDGIGGVTGVGSSGMRLST